MRASVLVLALFSALTLLATQSFAETYECTRTLPYTVRGVTFPANGIINGDLTVAAGKTCELHYITVTGNVRVHGTLTSYNSAFQGNVTVIGGQFTGINGNAVAGNLTIMGSSYDNGIWGPTAIGGNLTVVGNAGANDGGNAFYVGQATVGHYDSNNNAVAGNVVVSDNTGRVDIGGVTPLGTLVCKGNAWLAAGQPCTQ